MCMFGKSSVIFSGDISLSSGVVPFPDEVTVIRNYPEPRSYPQLRQLLTLANGHPHFIPNCLEIICT